MEDIALDIEIESAIDSYRWKRERAWGKVEGGQKVLDISGQVAGAVLRISRELLVPAGFEARETWRMVRDLAEKDGLSDEVTKDLQIALAGELVPDTEAMAQRCLEVTKEVVFREPNASVRRFLQRLTRCYIAGFFPECVMLCRAVLENAVTEVVTSLQLKPAPNREGHVGMGAKLDELLRIGRLTDETRGFAALVWKRGNTAVHKDPTAVQEVMATIDMAVRVLAHLYNQPLPVNVSLPDA